MCLQHQRKKHIAKLGEFPFLEPTSESVMYGHACADGIAESVIACINRKVINTFAFRNASMPMIIRIDLASQHMDRVTDAICAGVLALVRKHTADEPALFLEKKPNNRIIEYFRLLGLAHDELSLKIQVKPYPVFDGDYIHIEQYPNSQRAIVHHYIDPTLCDDFLKVLPKLKV